ncbi:restriction endonuclease [Ornithinimicrobium sufpigmenti]|uniref:restriction endonuclease n=1 Tax=Ornithinimicrobium sufpigmenti TaxID=2508882 RepID=UPI0015E19494|nr:MULTISPECIES: restriction endonuclease [unclassified Ornithinimicrobium]
MRGQSTSDAKGKAFEALAEFLFQCLGCRTKRNITSPLHSEQLDLVGVHLGALNPLPTFFIIECKYWEDKVDSKAVGYFINICRSRKAKLAIIFSKNGLTGSAKDQTAAHSIAFGAANDGIHLILVTEADIERLSSDDDFANMLIDAWILAAAGAGVGLS